MANPDRVRSRNLLAWVWERTICYTERRQKVTASVAITKGILFWFRVDVNIGADERT